jgi:hypothetical protein
MWEQRGVDADRFFADLVSLGRVVFRIDVINLVSFDSSKFSKPDDTVLRADPLRSGGGP